MKIYKYILVIADEQIVMLEEGFEILTVQIQNGVPVMWVYYAKDSPLTVEVGIKTMITGSNSQREGEQFKYISTYQLGGFVGHVFQIVK